MGLQIDRVYGRSLIDVRPTEAAARGDCLSAPRLPTVFPHPPPRVFPRTSVLHPRVVTNRNYGAIWPEYISE